MNRTLPYMTKWKLQQMLPSVEFSHLLLGIPLYHHLMDLLLNFANEKASKSYQFFSQVS